MAALYSTGLTKVMHRAPYSAISPTRPELSQQGRTVLVTGSSAGIGLAIARGFAKARAATVILTGRHMGPLAEAVETLTAQFPETSFVGRQVDISDLNESRELWARFEADGLVVDVLVLSAARIQSEPITMLKLGHKAVWDDYVTNVSAHYDATVHFYYQKGRDPSRKLSLLNVSTMAIHDFNITGLYPNYATTKNACAMLIQQIAKDISADDMQMISFHPGIVFTPAVRRSGTAPTSFNWDDEDLPGHYAVWAASDEAKFLHGRFTWAAWDVEELRTGDIGQRIADDPSYLRVGVLGL